MTNRSTPFIPSFSLGVRRYGRERQQLRAVNGRRRQMRLSEELARDDVEPDAARPDLEALVDWHAGPGTTVKGVATDVEVMSRQTSIVPDSII